MTEDFFGSPPPPPEPEPEEEESPPKPWYGPPENVLGGTVALDLVLATTDEVAVAITSVTAYPEGVSLPLIVRGKRFDTIMELDDEWAPFRHRRRGRDPEQSLRFGVQFSDGSKATNVRDRFHVEDEPPAPPLLSQHGGGGGGREYRHRFWLWPLPPRGPLAFVLEWRSAGIPLTRREVDGDVIRAAADRASTLWPEVREPGASRLEDSQWFTIGIEEADEGDEDE